MSRTSLRDEIRQTRPFRSDAQEAVVALLLTTDLLQRSMTRLVEPEGITAQQFNVLRILRGSHPEPLPTLEIATRMIEQTPGITRLLDRLDAKGLVRRERGSDDRRCVYCSITPHGLALVRRLDEPVHRLALDAFRGVRPNDCKQLLRTLDLVRQSLRAAASEP